jgi:hypothetical protein
MEDITSSFTLIFSRCQLCFCFDALFDVDSAPERLFVAVWLNRGTSTALLFLLVKGKSFQKFLMLFKANKKSLWKFVVSKRESSQWVSKAEKGLQNVFLLKCRQSSQGSSH